jgi:hypothetical protein
MFNYLRGEIYRLLRKKSLYIYFGAFALAYILLAFIRMGSGGADRTPKDAASLFTFLPPIVGGYLFSAIYTDDLNAKTLPALIGFGTGKAAIIFTKLILAALFSAVIMALIPLFMCAVNAVFGAGVSFSAFGGVYARGLKAWMETVAFASLSAAAVYGLQRATFGMVTYLLLSLGIVSRLLGALFSWEPINNLLPGLSNHLMAGISLRTLTGLLMSESIAPPIAEYVIYVSAAAALSVLAFRKKELEF